MHNPQLQPQQLNCKFYGQTEKNSEIPQIFHPGRIRPDPDKSYYLALLSTFPTLHPNHKQRKFAEPEQSINLSKNNPQNLKQFNFFKEKMRKKLPVALLRSRQLNSRPFCILTKLFFNYIHNWRGPGN